MQKINFNVRIHILHYKRKSVNFIYRPERFSNWPAEKWKNLSDPNWEIQKEPSKKSCFIKNYDYEKANYSIKKSKTNSIPL